MCTGTNFPLCNLCYYLRGLDLLLFCTWVAECGHAVIVLASAMLHCNMLVLDAYICMCHFEPPLPLPKIPVDMKFGTLHKMLHNLLQNYKSCICGTTKYKE